MIIEPNKAIFDNVISEYDGRRILINGWTMLRGQKWSDEEKNDTDSFCFSLDANGLELEKDVAPLITKEGSKRICAA